MAQEQTTRIVTGKVRFCYVNAFEPKAMNEGEEPRYTVCILIDKTDENTLNKINAAIEAAKVIGKNKLAGKNGKVPTNVKTTLRDGDIDRPDEEAFAGKMFVNANSVRKPQVVDINLNPILDKDEFYSGCYGRASLNFYAYDFNGNKGIACGLCNLQKLEDGERFDGGASAEEDFGDDLA